MQSPHPLLLPHRVHLRRGRNATGILFADP
ncbi:uncharacterized protein METZ01_LOCUS471758 [marine metagenome]|uniref:Uncharacterized protein n=1 Tax=marine metagenome TaxID=408172 RepID=A0A383BG87_9ZZZZ